MKPKARGKGFIEVKTEDVLSFKESCVENEDFSKKGCRKFVSMGSKFKNCSFEGLRCETMSFGVGKSISVYSNCSFNDSEIFTKSVGNARFENCSFEKVNILELRSTAGEFINCKFSGKISTAIFNASLDKYEKGPFERERNEFYGNDFSGLEMNDTAFRGGVDLTLQKLPQDEQNYLYIENGEQYLFKLDNSKSELTNKAMYKDIDVMSKILHQDLETGQQQFFIIKDDVGAETFDYLVNINKTNN